MIHLVERTRRSNNGPWVSSPAADLDLVLSAARQTGLLALDTEFVRDQTYFPELALLQLAARTPDGVRVALIDPLAPDAALGLEALAEVLDDARVTKALHSASQDFDVLRYVLGIVPSPLFDSQLAAAELDLGRQLSYAALVEAVLGLTLEKGAQRADWLRRPLSPALIDYATADVLHLVPLVETLSSRLAEAGKLAACTARCADAVASARRDESPSELADRVKGGSRLAGVARRRLQALAAWRENEARGHNVPRRWLAEDEALLAIARSDRLDLASLAQLEAVPPTLRAKYGDVFVKLVS